jgi:sugar-phosphatase
VVFEDAVAGFESAHAAGMDCIGVREIATTYSGVLRGRIQDFTELTVSHEQKSGLLRLTSDNNR